MCGRFSLAAELPDIMEEFQVEQTSINFRKRYNLAPTQRAVGVVNKEGTRTLEEFHWGLVPAWATDKKIAYNTINARAETVQTKPAFRSIFTRRRMVVCASSFFEWKTTDKEKQPYCIGLKDRNVLGFAGLYDLWNTPDGEILQSCTIITVECNAFMKNVHDRMPAILDREGVETWLDPAITDKNVLQSLLAPYADSKMMMYPVSSIVGNVRNETPEVLVNISGL